MKKNIFSFGLVLLAVFVFGSFFTTTALAELPTVTFIIRNGDLVIYQNTVPLPDAGTISIIDSNNTLHDVNTQSVLAILKEIDDASEAFSISNLQYFDSFGAFYLKCILLNAGEDLCDNWQYAIGSVTPFSSIDATILSGGETIGIYFGTTHQLVLSANTITAGGSLDATAQKYDYENNAWNSLTEVSVGVTLSNPDNPWSPIVVSTHLVDELGNANIIIADADTYTLGIVEDFYFPSYTVTVSAPQSSGGGGGGSVVTPAFSALNALAYLKSVQAGDGSFSGSTMYTDWTAIAFGAINETSASRDLLLSYLSSNNTTSGLLSDNERRAMALLALGQNPYSFNGVNYIKAIVESFDGTQFGDANLVNDDIFALIPLSAVGYTASDEIITTAIAFIISKQNANGSWENSVDMTAAGIQALKPFESTDGVLDAILKAENYLKDKQGADGGWGGVSATSWAMQAMSALGASWANNGKTGMDYLATQQANANNNGSVLSSSASLQNNIWETSYAIPAGLGKPWSAIMQSVSRPTVTNDSPDDAENNEPETIVEVSQTEELAEPEEVANLKEEISPSSLTASATSALPAQAGLPQKTIPPSAPIAIGVVSGSILLYAGFKFFFV